MPTIPDPELTAGGSNDGACTLPTTGSRGPLLSGNQQFKTKLIKINKKWYCSDCVVKLTKNLYTMYLTRGLGLGTLTSSYNDHQ